MMRAIAAFIVTDARLFWRSGYVAATLVVLVILLALLSPISNVDFDGFADLMTAVILIDQAIAPVMLTGFLLLAERNEGALANLAVTPAPSWLGLAVRMVMVSGLCLFEMLALVLIVYDGALNHAALVGGLFAIGAMATLAGVIIAAPFDSVFRVLLPMIGVIFALSVPGYSLLIAQAPLWVDLWPTGPAAALLQAAFEPTGAGRMIYASLGSIAWIGVAFIAALWSLRTARARLGAA